MRMYCALISSVLSALLLPGVVAWGQPAPVSRILRSIDFEERRLGNPEDLPMHWAKVVEGTNLPHYVNGRLTTDRAHRGQYSFRFDLNGGGLIYRYDAGQIPVHRGAHYRVEAFMQTSVLPHARARMTAYFVDQDRRPITSTIRHSEPYAAQTEQESWKRLTVELSADDAEAAFLVIELGLLQPMHYAPSTLGQRTLHAQDIRGSAWFDDVTVSQVPKVHISTDRPGNIFRRGDTLRLQVLVNDRFTDDLAGQLLVRDAQGRTVYQRSGALDTEPAAAAEAEQRAGPTHKRAMLDLPDLPAGWYEAALVMTSQGQFVGEQTIRLVRLADDAPHVPADPRFGLIATDLPFEGWDELPDLLPYLAAGRVKLAVWNSRGDIQQLDPAGFDRLLEGLAELGITPTACLVDLPPSLAQKVNGRLWQQLLKADVETWRPQLAYLVSRHANHLDRWQLGADGSDAFVTVPAMRDVYAIVYKEFATLVQSPDLAMPWPAWYELEGQLPATVAMSVPPSVLPSQLPLYMQELRQQKGHNLSLSLQLLDRQQYGRETQIRDLAQRVIYALAADAKRIDIPLPFTVQQEGDDLIKQPQEMLLVVRTLITTLSGSTYKGRVPIADGVEAFLFERNGKGILALWDRGSNSGVKRLTLNLGQRPMCVDLWGNVTPLLKPTQSVLRKGGDADIEDDSVPLQVGPMPMFLVDIDGQMAQLRASLGFDRPLIESSFEPHVRRIHFTNPYRQAISGTLKLKAPAGWTLSPPSYTFSLNPGETFDRDMTIEFPYNSYAGPKALDAEFTIQGERNTTFTVPMVLNLGLSDVGMQTLALRDGDDVIVQQVISNYGDHPIDYTAFAIFPGQARQERLVTNLGAGRATIKRYRFPNVTLAPNTRVRVGVKELTGTRILNDEIEIQ